MKITWRLEKKRGNWRPLLKVEVLLDPWEKALAPGKLRFWINMPRHGVADKGDFDHLWDPRDLAVAPKLTEEKDSEKREADKKQYAFIECFGGFDDTEFWMNAPWVEPGKEALLEEQMGLAMERLRAAVEKQILDAYASAEISSREELGLSEEAKKILAAYVAGAKMSSGKKAGK